MIHPEITQYDDLQQILHREICRKLSEIIDDHLKNSENKIWHRHPVWFIEGNPIVGYSIEKKGVRLMFWSGKSFDDKKLNILGGKFQDASLFYNSADEISEDDLKIWLKKSEEIQWDYKNIVLRKGVLERLK